MPKEAREEITRHGTGRHGGIGLVLLELFAIHQTEDAARATEDYLKALDAIAVKLEGVAPGGLALAPAGEDGWARYQASYRAFVLSWARVAQAQAIRARVQDELDAYSTQSTLLYLLAAVLGVVACRSLKLPPMLGYLAVGVVIGGMLAATSRGGTSIGFVDDKAAIPNMKFFPGYRNPPQIFLNQPSDR